MTTSNVHYQGELRTQCVHLQSNSQIVTDAPIDNNGKGEAFSPTDLVATSLAACMLTVMGIKANQMELDISGAMAEVTKVMVSEPRRIGKIKVIIDFPARNFSEKDKIILENTARTCPVLFSLHPDIQKDIQINWL